MARFGSLGTQYFNASGEPLVNGLIYFYESGTTTPKATYADINQTVANPNPVVLDASGYQPNIFFNGVAKAVLATSANVQIQTRDPVGDTAVNIPFQEWVPNFSYSLNDLVLGSNGEFYISLENGNIGNDPTISPTEWEPFFESIIIGQDVVAPNFVAIGNATTGFSGLDVTAKGSILAGNGTVPIELPVSTNGYVLTADSTEPSGIKWFPVDPVRDYEAFTASDTWAKPANAAFVYVQLWGAGGGGANITASSTSAGGGSGGEYIEGWFEASDLTPTVAVTVGAGGAGGANAGDNNGTVGGNSSFGAYLVAIGGNPGVQTANTCATIPRSGATTVDATVAGLFLLRSVFPQSGYGGSGLNGGNTQYGGGGGGGSSGTTGGTSAYGGNGGAGNNTLNTAATNGAAPAGGGGGSGNNGGGGTGARGEVRVWTW